MAAGRPRRVDPGELYTFAQLFYWDFRHLLEGSVRWRFDEKQHAQLVAKLEKEELQLTEEEKSWLIRLVEEEIQAGRTKESGKEARLKEVEEKQLFVTREWLLGQAADQARIQVKIPGEPETLKELLNAKTPGTVQRICKDAFTTIKFQVEPGNVKDIKVNNWPIPVGSVLPTYLSQFAKQFIEARADRRYPRSNRPSNCLKQIWFLSRALAGALYGIRTRTAINLIGSKRPEQVFKESRAAKPVRKTK
jgi:hypothetical protein